MSGSSNTAATPEVATNNPSIALIKIWEGVITKVMGDGLTGPNWVTWKVRMMSLLALCEAEPYVRGEIQQPNKDDDPVGHDNWKRNDNFAKHLVIQNVSDEAIIHIRHGTTSHVVWNNLKAIYEDDDEHSVNEPSGIIFDDSKKGQFFNFDQSNSRLLYYDWLGDTATTSHVSNRREAFTTFHPLTDTTVSGVGNVKTKVKGRGTVELMSTYNGHNHTHQLENVLYIPSNRNNLISLGRWDKAGGQYVGGGGALTLIKKDGTPVARGTQIGNNLYKMEVTLRQPNRDCCR